MEFCKLEAKEGRSCPHDLSLLSGLAEPKSLTLTVSQARGAVNLETLVVAEVRTSEGALTYVILLRTEVSHHEGSLSKIKAREMPAPVSLQFISVQQGISDR